MQEPELHEEQSLLLDGMELRIERREQEWEWEQINTLLPPMFPLDCWRGEEREQSPPLSPPCLCEGKGEECFLPDPWYDGLEGELYDGLKGEPKTSGRIRSTIVEPKG